MADKSIDPVKTKRISAELRLAGVTRYGRLKSEVDHLPKIIGDNEHILGAIYGTHNGSSAMLLVTDLKLQFIDVKPFHVVADEMPYHLIGDIHVDFGLLYAKVTVFAGPKTFDFSYVNQKCARIFVNSLERQVLAARGGTNNKTTTVAKPSNPDSIEAAVPNDPELNFIHRNNLAVISSFGSDGYPYGATVFYFCDSGDPSILHVITRDSTPTAKNTANNNKVSITISEKSSLSTMHIRGHADRETDYSLAQQKLSEFIGNEKLLPEGVIPPVAQLNKGEYIVLRITIASIYLHEYHGFAA
ncbi:PH domain-containing protein [Candidatus Saccharibacteria bacterium]|nr:PH domain-containing protein [Candidatus Saccharibacteria bacterium]MCB9821489.1 PH domain-containing protein [Candidatus Nomurabacteria bacterium]